MDGRGFGSGFSSWGGGRPSNRGSGNYDLYGYRDSGGFGGQMKRGLSGGSMFSNSSSNADAVIARLNQRLDMLTQLEGGMKGRRGDRFDQYESFDSRSSALDARDLYRSGNFVYGDSRGDMMAQRGDMGFGAMGGAGGGGGFDGSATFGSPKMRQARDTFSGSGWDAGHRSQYRGGRLGGLGGGQGLSPSGRGKPPSLFSHRMFPESRGFQPQPGSQFGNRRAIQQRFHKRPFKRQQQEKQQRDGQKKRKQAQGQADEPESKVGRTESAEDDDNKETDEMKEEETEDGADPGTEPKSETEGQNAEEDTEAQGKQMLPSSSKTKKKRGFFESRAMSRVMFSCSVCKFRSFYSEDMEAHLESKFHKDHFRFLSNQLSKPTSDFLQEYLIDKYKKTEQRVSLLDNHSATICQMLKDQDQTRDLGMEHFMKKVEAAYCSACDMYIPMQPPLIQKHAKSYDHNYNRKMMMEHSKRSSISVARSILNHKVIGKKLESFLKGENPFTDNADEQDPEDFVVMEVIEGESKPEKIQEEEEPAGDDAPEAVGNGEEKEEEPEDKMDEVGEGLVLDEVEGIELGEEEDEEVQEEEEEEGFEVKEEEEEDLQQEAAEQTEDAAE